MTKFYEIPPAEFPLNRDAYNRLSGEIGAIARRFSNIGTHDGAAVAKQMEKVYATLGDAWELIRFIEEREK